VNTHSPGPQIHTYITRSSEETIALGRELAPLLVPPRMLVLRGDLGAGKTTLVKGIAAALGAAEPEEITSPTFTLIHEYEGRLSSTSVQPSQQSVRLYHIDVYRLESQRQLETLGMEELLTPDSILLVEWGEKFPWIVAHSQGEISIHALHDDERRITLSLR
jgi:tRNA threonylcarbamoyladenosine biosynthesis protein TsaE